MRTLLFWALCLMIGLPVGAFAQEATISGTVTDDDNQPLPSVNVIIQELTLGASTDVNGQYTIVVPANLTNNQQVTLRVRFLGFEEGTKLITLSPGTQTHDFQLAEDLLNLDEVVVTGTGAATSTKRLGINVESVDEDRLLTAQAMTVETALQGKVAGSNIQQVSGQPGVASQITLRGINTLGSTTPMILVDGVEVNTDNNFAGFERDGITLNVNSRLADIDFNDVERIEVVKGAAAATIYGAQGANGVIQIFTKKGQAGKPKLSVSTSMESNEILGLDNVQTSLFHPFPVDNSGFIDGLSRNDATGQWTVPNFDITPTTLINNPYAEPTFNSINTVLQDATTQRFSASLSGGNPGFTYLLSANVQDQEGIQINTFNIRRSYRANFGINPIKNLNIAIRANFVDADNRGTENGDNVTGPLQNALFARPFINLEELDGEGNTVATLLEGERETNPLFENEVRSKDIDVNRFINSVNANYTPFPWLELDAKIGVDHYRYGYNELQRNFESNSIAALDPAAGFVWNIQDKATNVNALTSAFLRFKVANNLNTTTQLAFDVRRETFDRVNSLGQTLAPFESTITLRSTSDFSIDQEKLDFNSYGFLINEKIEFQETAGISFGGRFDYSSAFGQGQDPSFFPRGDVYLRLSELDFWNPVSNVINEFKIRAAYGEAGTQPAPYDRIVTLDQTSVGSNGTLIPGNTLNNPLLLVEESKEFEVGGDITILGGRNLFSPISISATYWDRMSANVLEPADLPPSSGASSIVDNSVDIASSGIDLSLDALVYHGDNLTWRSGVNFGTAESFVESTPGGLDIVVHDQYLLREGERVGTHFGDEVVRSLDEVDADGNPLLDPAGNYEIIDGMVVDVDSRAVQFRPTPNRIGSAEPDFTLSFRNDVTLFKNLDMSMQWDWVEGQDIYNRTRQWLYRDLQHEEVGVPVTIGGETGAFAAYYTSIYHTNVQNELFVEDGSFIRLREVTVSYDFSDFVKIPSVQRMRLTASGRNLLTFTDYSGFDPEVSHFGNDSRIRGLDEFTYPNFRTFSLGLNVVFQ